MRDSCQFIRTPNDRVFWFRLRDRWLPRQRIRMTMFGRDASVVPVDLHNQQLLYPEHRFWEHVRESEQIHSDRARLSHGSVADKDDLLQPKVLPVLALNEVFIGESLSSRWDSEFVCCQMFYLVVVRRQWHVSMETLAASSFMYGLTVLNISLRFLARSSIQLDCLYCRWTVSCNVCVPRDFSHHVFHQCFVEKNMTWQRTASDFILVLARF